MNGLDELLDFVGLRDPEQKEKFKKGEIENVKELLDAKAKADLEAFKSNEVFINAVKGERDRTKSSTKKMMLMDPEFALTASEVEELESKDLPEVFNIIKGKYASVIKKNHLSPDAHKDQEIINSLNATINNMTGKIKDYEEVVLPNTLKKIEEFKASWETEKKLEEFLVEDKDIKYKIDKDTIKELAFPNFLKQLSSDLVIVKAKEVKKLGYTDLESVSDNEFVVRKVDYDGKIGGAHFNHQHAKVTPKDLFVQYLASKGFLENAAPTPKNNTPNPNPNNKNSKEGYVDPSMTALLNSIK